MLRKSHIQLPKPRAIIFDWDNTLVDSWPVIHKALTDTFNYMQVPPWTLEETKERVGKSMRDQFPGLFGDRWQEAGDVYSKAYKSNHIADLDTLPLVREMLDALAKKNVYLAVVSNKQGPTLRMEATHMKMDHYFKKLIGANDAKRDKPFPDPLLLALEGTDIKPGPDVWFVGDSLTDVECAVGAGCTPIFYGDANLPEEYWKKVYYVDDHGHFQKVFDVI